MIVNKSNYDNVREYARTVGMFSVAMIMHELELGYDVARAAVAKLVAEKRAEYREGVMYEYTGSDRVTEKKLNAEECVKALEAKGDALDPLFCDALVRCARIGKVSASILQGEFNIFFTRAKQISDAVHELGFCEQGASDEPCFMLIGVAEAEEIVDKYRSAHIIVAPEASDKGGLSATEFETAVASEIERLCRRLEGNTIEEWRAKAKELSDAAAETGDKHNIEIAKAVAEYVEQSFEAADGESKRYIEWRRQYLIQKLSYELAGASGDSEEIKAKVDERILRVVGEHLDMTVEEIIGVVRDEASSADKNSDEYIVCGLAADELAAVTPLEFCLLKNEAKKHRGDMPISAAKEPKIDMSDREGIANLDVVFVIDAATPFIESLKYGMGEFLEKADEAYKASSKPLKNMRVRVVGFSDYGADGDEALFMSDMYSMPSDFSALCRETDMLTEMKKRSKRVPGAPGNGLEALYAAMLSDWNVDPKYGRFGNRQLIILLTDAYPLDLMERKDETGYPADELPPDIETLTEIWDDADDADGPTKLTNGRRLLLCAPEGSDEQGHTWSKVSSWSYNAVIAVEPSKGLADLDMNKIFERIKGWCW